MYLIWFKTTLNFVPDTKYRRLIYTISAIIKSIVIRGKSRALGWQGKEIFEG